jgi:acetylornithine deacetylase
MSSLQNPIETLQSFIAFESVSCSSNRPMADAASERLESLGFQVEQTVYDDPQGVAKVNLVARREPTTRTGGNDAATKASSGLAYFCHTDVVPAVGWTGPGGDPFAGVVRSGRLYGRGSCDMKGSLVAMLAAAFDVSAGEQVSPLWIVCTADEEVGFEGAKHLVRNSQGYREIVEAQPLAIIGEPTRLSVVHAHKGITGFEITSRGRAAHSSTRDGINANEAMVPMLQTLMEINERTRSQSKYLDHRFEPPTLSWNFGVSDGSNAVNITPEKSVAWVSLRPMPEIDGQDLIELVSQRAQSLGLEFKIFEGGTPFWIEPDTPCIQDLCELAGGDPKTVCYGTDGGEFTELKNRVVFGPGDIAQAHTTDEWIELDQLQQGTDLFAKAIRRWCAS